jgi:hypothetical protein
MFFGRFRCEDVFGGSLFSVSLFREHLSDELVVQFRARSTLNSRDAQDCKPKAQSDLKVFNFLLFFR